MLQNVNTHLAFYMIFHLNGNTHYYIFNNRVLSLVIIPLKFTQLVLCINNFFSNSLWYGFSRVGLTIHLLNFSLSGVITKSAAKIANV